MALSETRGRRLIVRWTAPRGLVALLLFVILTVFFEVLLAHFFLLFGLTDKNAWLGVFKIPMINWSFSVSISPLFHLLPTAVIIVLVSSWAYLTKYTAFLPPRAETTRRMFPPSKKGVEKHGLRGLSGFFRRFGRKMQRIGRSVKAGLRRIRGVSYVSRRLYFARAAVRSALAVVAVFLSVFVLICVMVFPGMVYHGVVGLYKANPSFLGFVTGTSDLVHGVGQVFTPINDGLLGVAPGFRSSLVGVGSSLTGLDLVSKYVLSQSVAAWVSALVALIYGMYVSSRRPRRR